MSLLLKAFALSISLHALVAASFQPKIPVAKMASITEASFALRSTSVEEASSSSSSYLYDPNQRDAHYDGNTAQYLVDLHNAKATFNFCGGMMFQLVLSEKLKTHLESIAVAAPGSKQQPIVFDASHQRMERISGYKPNPDADNLRIFHGREIRQVADATGGMGFVLQLSHSDEDDTEGWTSAEVEGYDGWTHDSGRVWRKGDRLESEGFSDFKSRFGPKAFTLHHRFYLHYDRGNSMWLSAEDGCEGTPAPSGSSGVVNRIASLMGLGA
mmetsp:Transcript_28019/g.65846  ORF Transcript_28019/g.65846 Transcript_28019/m.65846 type:complete len:270 (+) Transcript_28019:58-867(+)